MHSMCHHMLVTWNLKHRHFFRYHLAFAWWQEINFFLKKIKSLFCIVCMSQVEEEKENSFLLTRRSLAEVWKLLCQQGNLSLLMPHSHLTSINLFHPMMHLYQTRHIHCLLSSHQVWAGDGSFSLNTWMSPLQLMSLKYRHLNSRVWVIYIYIYTRLSYLKLPIFKF